MWAADELTAGDAVRPHDGDFVAITQVALQGQRDMCSEPSAVVDAVFRDLLDQACDTAIGREHGLGSVRTRAQWARALPIRGYDGFRPYVQRVLDGEDAVLTRSKPYAFLTTSGTTGEPKYVPSTSHWRRRYRGPALYAQWGLYFNVLGLSHVAGDTALDLSWERNPPVQSIGGFPVYSITQRWASLGDTDWTPPWYEEPWFQYADGSGDFAERTYRKLRLLAGRGVRMIVSVNPSKLVALAEHLAERSDQLIRDVRDGGLNGRPHTLTAPDPQLARRLEAARAYGDGALHLPDVWPELSLLVCWTSASARLYQPWLKRLIPGVAVLPFSTTGTEGIVTLPIDAHQSAGPLALNQGIYEFVPCSEHDEGAPLPSGIETLDYTQLDSGATYRLVMSQANGLYRYDTGDIYRVSGWVRRVPRLDFVARAGFQSSFTGEKLTELDIHAAVARALHAQWLNSPVFTCVPVWDTPPRYVLAIEWTDAMDGVDPDELALTVDAALRGVNIEYADKRASGRLQAVSVLALVPGAFRRVAERRMARGVSSAQIKHHWIQKDAALLGVVAELGLAAAVPRPVTITGTRLARLETA